MLFLGPDPLPTKNYPSKEGVPRTSFDVGSIICELIEYPDRRGRCIRRIGDWLDVSANAGKSMNATRVSCIC